MQYKLQTLLFFIVVTLGIFTLPEKCFAQCNCVPCGSLTPTPTLSSPSNGSTISSFPINFVIQNNVSSSVTIDEYRIQISNSSSGYSTMNGFECPDSKCSPDYTTSVVVNCNPGSGQSFPATFQVSCLKADTYYWIARVANSTNNTYYASVKNFTVPCFPVSSVSTSSITQTSAKISWPSSCQSDSYSLKYKLASSSTWTNLTGITSAYKTISGLQCGTDYDVQVCVVSNGVSSSWTSTSFTTSQCSASSCDPPASLNSTAGTTSVSLDWTAVSGSNVLGYDVYYKLSSSGSWINAVSGYGSTNYLVSGLSTCTSYDFQVRTSCTSSAYSSYTQSNNVSTTGCSSGCTVSDPIISPSGQNFSGSISVSISCSTSGAYIHYTTDGSNPNCSSQTYLLPISLTSTSTVKAIACKATCNNSGVVSATYTLNAVATCSSTTGPIKVITPRNGTQENARTTLFKWEHELGRSIDHYELSIKRNGTLVDLAGQPNPITAITIDGGIASCKIESAAWDNGNAYSNTYQFHIEAFKANNELVTCYDGSYTVMKEPQIEPTCNSSGSSGGLGTALGHMNNVVVYKNGCKSQTDRPTVQSSIYGNSTKRPYGFQCAEFSSRYYHHNYDLKKLSGNGKDYANQTGNRTGMLFFKNASSTILPQEGDLLSFAKGTYGHIAIVSKIDANAVYSTQQNMGSLTHINYTLPYSIDIKGAIHLTAPVWKSCLAWVRAEPMPLTPGNANSIDQTNAPLDFKWVEHDKCKNYTLFVSKYNEATNAYEPIKQQTIQRGSNSGTITFTTAIPASSSLQKFKWRLAVAMNAGSIQSRPFYFSVLANSPIPSATYTIIPNGKQINGYLHKSEVANGSISFKTSEGYSEWARSDEKGRFSLYFNSINQGDSLMVQAANCYPIRLAVDNFNITNSRLMLPMIYAQNNTAVIEQPKVEFVSPQPIFSSPDVQVKVTARHINYIAYNFGDGDDFKPLSVTDSIFTIHVSDTGINNVNFFFSNGVDTINVNTEINYCPASMLAANSYQVQLIVPNELNHSKCFINGLCNGLLTVGTKQFTMPVGVNTIVVSRFGYKDIELICDTTSSFQLSPTLLQYSSATDNVSVKSKTNEAVGWRNQTLVNKSACNGVFTLKQFDNTVLPTKKVIAKTRTFDIQNTSNVACANLSQSILLDQPEYLAMDSVYLLDYRGNKYLKFTSPSASKWSFDSTYQKLDIYGIDFNGGQASSEEFTLCKKQKALPRETGFKMELLQDKLRKFDFYSLFRDQDSIKKDMTFVITSNPQNMLSFVSGDTLCLKGNAGWSGNSSITAQATHDGLPFSYSIPIITYPWSALDFSYSGVCVGSPTLFKPDVTTINPAIVTSWNWSFGDGTYGNSQNAVHVYAGSGTYTAKLVVHTTLGVSDSVTKFVTIEKLPIAFFYFDTPTCNADSVQFHDLSSTMSGYIKRWVWNFGDGSANDTIIFPDNPSIKHRFPSFGTFNVTLQVMNSDSCVSQSTLAVVVIPSPVANFHFDGQCQDQIVKFTDASSANGAGNVVGWNWDFGDPISGVNNTSNITDPTHLFQFAGTYTVKLVVTNYNNCTDTMTKQVTIHPHPPVDFSYTITCLNELINFNPDPVVTNIPAIATWLWDFGDGLTSNVGNTQHAYIAPGVYTVTLTVTDTMGCMNVVSKEVTIHELPVAHFSTGANNCAGAHVSFTDHSSTVFGYVVRWIWNFGDGTSMTVIQPANPNVTHLYAVAGSYNVTLTVKVSDSCSNVETQVVVVHPNPVANFVASAACFGTAVNFTDLTQLAGGGSISQWQWDFGDLNSGVNNISTLQSPSHSYTSAGNYTVKLIVSTSNGCSDTVSRPLVVKPLPGVNFTSTHNCQNNAVIFAPDATVMTVGAVASWAWDFGDAVTATTANPTHTYANAGTYQVKLTIIDTAGCTNTITKPVTIIAQPTANFTFSHPACKQSAVQFTNQSNASTGYIVKNVWNFGDGTPVFTISTLDNVSHTYANYGTFNVTLTVTTNDSCKRTITLPIVIAPNPLANFSYLTTCVNSPVEFNDLSQAGAGGLAEWNWNFGDPPSGANNTALVANPTHIFTAGGTYQVALIVSNTGGCQDTVTKPVIVHSLPTVDFTTASGCVNDSTHFISSTFVNANATTSRLWDFGDGFTSPNIDPFHIYTSSGSFTVTLTVTDTAGCINTKTHIISVVPPPTPFFQISQQTCSTLPVQFTNLSSTSGGTITTFTWDFGDGNDTILNAPASGNISHTYTTAGNFTVKLKVHTSLGCDNDYSQPITISASPLALFNYTNTCAGAGVNFHDLSQVNTGTTLTSWLWTFGDPTSGTNNTSILQNPLHIYNTAGNYTVQLQVQNASNCPDTVTKTVVVHAKPPVDYSWASICLGTSTTFSTNTTVTNVTAVTSYDWDFGDGTVHNTTQQNPVHKYAVTGNFTVVLTIVDTAGCVNSVSHVVAIHPQPTAQFSMTNACLGASTYFTDQSFTSSGEPVNGWRWDFGVTTATNDTSDVQNPSWVYTALGVYNINLIATSQSGCQDTATMSLQVFGNPTASFHYTAAPCNNGAVYFQDSSYNQQSIIVGWNWEFEPNHFSTLQNPVYVYYATDSCYDVKLIVTDVRGCVDTTSKQVCVPPKFDFTFASTATCFRDSTYFSPQLLSPLTDSLVFFNWNFGEPNSGINNTSTLKHPSHYYSQPGIYTVSLQSTDVNVCAGTKYLSVTVKPLPVPLFSYVEGICDSTIYFNQTSSGSGSDISRWIWSYGDGKGDTISAVDSANVHHLYANAGLYVVGLTITNAKGCTNNIIDSNVLVKPCISAKFELIDTLVCQNNTLSFADSTFSGIPANEWYWNFGDGKDTTYYSAVDSITHIFTSSGTFNVMLRVSTTIVNRTVSDSTFRTVVVNATPLPDFSFGKICFKQEAAFTNMTSGNGTLIKDFKWSFGEPASAPNDTSTFRNTTHLYAAPGTFDVQLAATNTIGCKDSISKQVTVFGLPEANYQYTLSCAGDKTTFTDASVISVAPLVSWKWIFSDTVNMLGERNIQNPDFTFALPGKYIVNLMVQDTNGCYDTINQHITTWSVPSTIYTFTDNFNDVQGQLKFDNMSIDATKYYWTFGNGNDSWAEKPVAFYQKDGTYSISLITWNDKGCTDTLVTEYTFMVKGLYIPTAFSPNNPKTSVQLLKPVGINIKEYRFEVYDRWGNMLWWTDKLDDAGRPTEGWDGKYNGVLMQEGVYVWKASAIFNDGMIWDANNIGNNDIMPKTKVGTSTMIK